MFSVKLLVNKSELLPLLISEKDRFMTPGFWLVFIKFGTIVEFIGIFDSKFDLNFSSFSALYTGSGACSLAGLSIFRIRCMRTFCLSTFCKSLAPTHCAVDLLAWRILMSFTLCPVLYGTLNFRRCLLYGFSVRLWSCVAEAESYEKVTNLEWTQSSNLRKSKTCPKCRCHTKTSRPNQCETKNLHSESLVSLLVCSA